MLEQSMAIVELKKAVINHETSPAPTHWARFGDCRNQLVAKYIGNVVTTRSDNDTRHLNYPTRSNNNTRQQSYNFTIIESYKVFESYNFTIIISFIPATLHPFNLTILQSIKITISNSYILLFHNLTIYNLTILHCYDMKFIKLSSPPLNVCDFLDWFLHSAYIVHT